MTESPTTPDNEAAERRGYAAFINGRGLKDCPMERDEEKVAWVRGFNMSKSESVTTRHEEYFRRNMVHAKAVGAHANAEAALDRLCKSKRAPLWLIDALEGIIRRTDAVHPEIAKWRNSAPDAPEYMK